MFAFSIIMTKYIYLQCHQWRGTEPMRKTLPIIIVSAILLISAASALVSETPTGENGEMAAYWEGNVTLAENATFNVTAENSGMDYSVGTRTALGALEATGLNYTVSDEFFESYGSLFVDSIDGRATEGMAGWFYQLNGAAPAVGANVQDVEPDDEVIYYWSGDVNTTPETSDRVIVINVLDGTVTLVEETFTVTAANSGEEYNVERLTALGALDASGLEYTVSDEYYESYGSLFIESIDGLADEGTAGWLYLVNGEQVPVGANVANVTGGDAVTFYYGEGMEATQETAERIFTFEVTSSS
jgi:hypothetical protein